MTTEKKEAKEFFVRNLERPTARYSGAIHQVKASEVITEALEELEGVELARVILEAAGDYLKAEADVRLHEVYDKASRESFEEFHSRYNDQELAAIVYKFAYLQLKRKVKEGIANGTIEEGSWII